MSSSSFRTNIFAPIELTKLQASEASPPLRSVQMSEGIERIANPLSLRSTTGIGSYIWTT